MMLIVPTHKPTGSANLDAVWSQDLRNFADWIIRMGGLDAAEQKAADALANAENRLAALYPGNPDAPFAQPHLGCDHEAGVWRRDRDDWRNTVATLAHFRAFNPVQEAA